MSPASVTRDQEAITFALSRALGDPELAMQASTMIATGVHNIRAVCERFGFDEERTSEIEGLYHASLQGVFCSERVRERLEPVKVMAPINTPSNSLKMDLQLVVTAKQAAQFMANNRDNVDLADLKPLGEAFGRALRCCRSSSVSLQRLLEAAENAGNGGSTTLTDQQAPRAVALARKHEVDAAKLTLLAQHEESPHAKGLLAAIARLSARVAKFYYDAVGAHWVPSVPIALFRDRKTGQVLDRLRYGSESDNDHVKRQTIQHLTGVAVGSTSPRTQTSDVLLGSGTDYVRWHVATVEKAQVQARIEWCRAVNQTEGRLMQEMRPKVIPAVAAASTSLRAGV